MRKTVCLHTISIFIQVTFLHFYTIYYQARSPSVEHKRSSMYLFDNFPNPQIYVDNQQRLHDNQLKIIAVQYSCTLSLYLHPHWIIFSQNSFTPLRFCLFLHLFTYWFVYLLSIMFISKQLNRISDISKALSTKPETKSMFVRLITSFIYWYSAMLCKYSYWNLCKYERIRKSLRPLWLDRSPLRVLFDCE